ncbi:MAG: alpha-ketoglutarate decarboxylase [Microbacteriaceae bacterium]|nr:alpha-ketoglutarate decarboxylase [Microbacteriaceae bacterium]
MSGCGCEHARANLEELIRGELEETDCQPIREHLEGCTECRDEQQVFETLTVAVRRACEGPAPASLRETIVTQLRDLH